MLKATAENGSRVPGASPSLPRITDTEQPGKIETARDSVKPHPAAGRGGGAARGARRETTRPVRAAGAAHGAVEAAAGVG